ncbi:sigma-70 family RNA polymerase sigma factor, partial [gut metagenome]
AVYGLALSYLKNSDDAEDVTQDTFVQVWNCAAGFKPQGHAMAWLMTVTRNMALGRIRSQSRLDHMEPEEWEKLPDESAQPQAEEKILLREMLQCLSPTESRIVTLHAVSGLKHREIAALLEIPLATELSRYHRSLKKLKTMMEGEDLQ